MVDAVAHRYGKLPSEIIGIEDDVTAFQFNSSVLLKSVELEELQMEEQTKQQKKKKPKKRVFTKKKIDKNANKDALSSLSFAKAKANVVKGVKNG